MKLVNFCGRNEIIIIQWLHSASDNSKNGAEGRKGGGGGAWRGRAQREGERERERERETRETDIRERGRETMGG